MRRNLWSWGALVVIGSIWSAWPVEAQRGAKEQEWRVYSADSGSTKYAPLDQINKDNVAKLHIAWRRPAVDKTLMAIDPKLTFGGNFRVTPIMVKGVMYSPNGVGLVEA